MDALARLQWGAPVGRELREAAAFAKLWANGSFCLTTDRDGHDLEATEYGTRRLLNLVQRAIWKKMVLLSLNRGRTALSPLSMSAQS